MFDESGNKILVIEDDLAYRSPLGDYLSAHGFTVSTADDGEMAMEKLLFHKPNLVILDLLLPKVHGFEVLKRIRSYPDQSVAETPVIVLSNLSDEKDIETAKALKITDYMVKSQTTNEDVLKKAQELLFPGQPPRQEQTWDFSKL